MIFLIRNLASVITPDQPKYTIHHCAHWLLSFISYIINDNNTHNYCIHMQILHWLDSFKGNRVYPKTLAPLGVRTHIHATSFQVLGGFVFWRTHPRVASWSSCSVFSWHLLIQGSCSYHVANTKNTHISCRNQPYPRNHWKRRNQNLAEDFWYYCICWTSDLAPIPANDINSPTWTIFHHKGIPKNSLILNHLSGEPLLVNVVLHLQVKSM